MNARFPSGPVSVACIGAGPASLTVARDLAVIGYQVSMFDCGSAPGGMVRSQIPKFLGLPGGTPWWKALASPELWQWESIVIGAATAVVMVFAPLVTRVVPAAILGLLAGVLTYFGLAAMDESLLVIEGNKLIITNVRW